MPDPRDLRAAADASHVAPPRAPSPLARLKAIAKKAHDAPVGVPPEQVDAYVQQATGLPSLAALDVEITRRSKVGARDLGRSAAMGATFNFLPEIVEAAGRGLITSPGQPGLAPDPGAEAQAAALRARHQEFTADQPVASILAGVGGAMAGPGLGALPLMRGTRSVLGGLGRGALIGGTEGAIAGAGGAGPGRRLEGALEGGLLGVPVGAAAGGIGAYLAGRGATAGGRRLGEAVDMGGEGAIMQAAGEAARSGRGGVAWPADLSMALQDELDFAARNNAQVAGRVVPELEARSAGAGERMSQQAQELLGERPLASVQDEALEAVRKEAGEAIDNVGDRLLDDPRVEEILQRPIIATAVKNLREAGAMAGDATIEPSFRTLNSIRQQLNAMASEAFDSKKLKFMGPRYQRAAEEIDDLLSELVPEFRDLQAGYRRAMQNIEAAEEGTKWLHKNNADALRTLWESFTPAQRDAFRTRLAAGMIDELENARTNTNLVDRFIRAGRGEQAKLEIIFGDQQTLARFMEGARTEWRMRRTASSVRQRSPTHHAGVASELGPEGLVRPSGLVDRALTALQSLGRRRRLRRENAATGAQMEPLLARPVDDIGEWLRGIRAGDPRGAGLWPLGAAASDPLRGLLFDQ